jgi:integrase
LSPSAAWHIEGILATAIASASVLIILVPIVGFAQLWEPHPRRKHSPLASKALLGNGEPPNIVSERLGHASVTLTLDTDSRVLPGMQEQATERLEALLFRSRPGKQP